MNLTEFNHINRAIKGWKINGLKLIALYIYEMSIFYLDINA